MTVAEENGVRKLVPTDKVFVIDLKANPPKLVQTVTVGKQPSGLSFSPKGDMALVANRADGTISELKIDGSNVTQTDTIPISPGVSHVEFAPDGKHALALKSPDNKVAVLDVDGDKVTYNKLDIPTYAFPYNVVIIAGFQTGDHRRQRQWRFIGRQCGRGDGDRSGGAASARDRSRHGGRCARRGWQ